MINSKFTIDLRYTGTLGRKQLGSIDINGNNVYTNPELFQALSDARAPRTANATAYKAYTDNGISPCDVNGDPVLLDQLLAGLNINNTVTGFGPVGQVVNVFRVAPSICGEAASSAGQFSTIQQFLSYGDFDHVADGIIGLAPLTAVKAGSWAPIDPKTGVALTE